MPWGAAIAAGGAIVGGLISSDASTSAANTQANAANQATAAQLQMFDQTRKDLAPYMQQGQIGLDQLNKLIANPNSVTTLPGYQFQLQQGQDAILNGAAAGGLTGNTLKALSQYGQGLASNYYNTAYSQDLSLANLGQTSAAGVGNIGTSVANSIGQNTIGAGNALAAGQVGSANAINTGINNGLQNWLLASALQGGQGSPYGTGGNGTGGYSLGGISYNNPSAYVGGP